MIHEWSLSTVSIPFFMILWSEVLYSIFSSQVVSLTQDPQYFVSKLAWYLFYRLWKDERLSEFGPTGSWNLDLQCGSETCWSLHHWVLITSSFRIISGALGPLHNVTFFVIPEDFACFGICVFFSFCDWKDLLISCINPIRWKRSDAYMKIIITLLRNSWLKKYFSAFSISSPSTKCDWTVWE